MRNYKNYNMFRASHFITEACSVDGLDTIEDDEILNTAIQDTINDKTYDVDVANPICPCCGCKLNIIDSDDTPDVAGDEIEVMDPSLEPDDNKDLDDTFVSIDDIENDEESEDSKEEDEDSEEE